MKQRKIFHFVGATLSLVAMGMASAVYACTSAEGTNHGTTTVIKCSTFSNCNDYPTLYWKMAADNCAVWCCGGSVFYDGSACDFHLKTWGGAPDCCYASQVNSATATWSCSPD